ncbi:MAG TPA: DUF4349 domain-containing protein [Acidimicrobiales bacterium]|nr:DUF4349 domain-containing protein [Acidimicrobiales bacterium]
MSRTATGLPPRTPAGRTRRRGRRRTRPGRRWRPGSRARAPPAAPTRWRSRAPPWPPPATSCAPATCSSRWTDAAAAADAVRRIATDAGGFVADEQERARDDEVDITVRVPAASFDEVREDIGALGDVVTQNVEARDVTAEMVDVESRIGSLRASVERLRGLLSEAGDVGQLAMVEGELARRETELEAMLGQQRVLADQVALGTLGVALSEDEQPTVAEDTPGFTEGLRNGWVAALAAGTVALAAVGFALPFAVPVLLALLAVRLWQRRRRPPAPTAAESQP